MYWYGAAAWSPDGSRIAVSAEGDSDGRKAFDCDYTMYAAVDGAPRPLILFRMAADGTDVEVLALTDEDGKLVGTWTSYADVAGNVAACSEGTVVKVCSAMPSFRQISTTGVPFSACLSANAICSGEYRDLFMDCSPLSRIPRN